MTPQGLAAALDLQVPIFGLGNTWMDGFSICLAQMIPYEYDRLLEYADLKYLHVCANSGTLKDITLVFLAISWDLCFGSLTKTASPLSIKKPNPHNAEVFGASYLTKAFDFSAFT